MIKGRPACLQSRGCAHRPGPPRSEGRAHPTVPRPWHLLNGSLQVSRCRHSQRCLLLSGLFTTHSAASVRPGYASSCCGLRKSPGGRATDVTPALRSFRPGLRKPKMTCDGQATLPSVMGLVAEVVPIVISTSHRLPVALPSYAPALPAESGPP